MLKAYSQVNEMNTLDYIERIDKDDIFIHLPQNFYTEHENFRNGVILISGELSITGAPIQMLKLAEVLCEFGYQPFVFSPFGGDMIEAYTNIGIPVICGTGTKVSAEWINDLVRGFDLIFINTLQMSSYVRYLADGKRSIFWWIHESSFLFNEKCCSNIPTVKNLKILAASETVREHIAKYMRRESEVLDVCTEDFGEVDKKTSGKTTFLWAGSLDYNKAPEVLFKAILDLPPVYTDKAEFIVVGQSHKANEYAELVEALSSKQQNIHYRKAIEHKEFIELIDEVDAVVVTSIEETTSMVAVEGLMKGKAVICSDGCGVTKYLKDGESGFVFPVGNAAMLSEKIKFIIDNNDRLDALRHKGRIIYDDNYSLKIFRQKLKRLVG